MRRHEERHDTDSAPASVLGWRRRAGCGWRRGRPGFMKLGRQSQEPHMPPRCSLTTPHTCRPDSLRGAIAASDHMQAHHATYLTPAHKFFPL